MNRRRQRRKGLQGRRSGRRGAGSSTAPRIRRVVVGLARQLTRVPVLVVLAVLLANLPALLGVVRTDPFLQLSGLLSHRVPGLVGVGRYSIDPNNGYTLQALGTRAALDWLHGQVPWWNPYEGLGVPLAAEMQSSAFLPLVLLLLLPRGVLLLHVVLEVVGGLATYLLARELGWGRSTQLALAVAFGLNGTMSWLGNAVVNPVAFLPLTVLGVERLLGRCRWGWTLTMLGVLVTLLSGFPETAALDLLFVAMWALVRLPYRRGRREAVSAAARAVGAASVGLLLSAPLLVPFAGYLLTANTGGHVGHGFAEAYVLPAGAATLGFPYLFGPIFGWLGAGGSNDLLLFWSNVGGYITFTTLVLAVVGLLAGRPVLVLRVALASWAGVLLARSYGVLPVLHALALVPGAGGVAVYRYCLPSCELAVVVLAGFGLQAMASSARRRTLLSIGAALAVAAVLWRQGEGLVRQVQGLPGYAPFALATALAAVLVLALATGVLVFPPAVRVRVLASVLGVEAALAFAVPQLSALRAARIDLAPVHFLRAHLGQQRFYSLGPIAPNYGSQLGLAELDVNDLPVPQLWSRLVLHRLAPHASPLVFTGVQLTAGPTPLHIFLAHEQAYEDAGVRYLLMPAGADPPALGPPVLTSPTTDIFRLPRARPLFATVAGGPCQLTLDSPTTATGSCAALAEVRWNELALAGWSATVNGSPVALHRTGYTQRLSVPAGPVHLQLSYVPPGEGLGLALAAAGLAATALVAGRRSVRARGKPVG